LALAPILLPIVLITSNSVVKVIGYRAIEADPTVLSAEAQEEYVHDGQLAVRQENDDDTVTLQALQDKQISELLKDAAAQDVTIAKAFQWTNFLGNPNFALLLSAAIAMWTLQLQRRPSKKEMAHTIEHALMSGGVIILITAAGGSFGAMLKAAGIGDAIQGLFGDAVVSGLPLLFFAFGLASLLKFAQGSSTAAMIVTSGMIAAMVDPSTLPFHPVYLATSIGAGSLVGSWMNDSGFWIFAKMGGLTETEALKSWTVMLVILGSISFAATVLLAIVMPLV